MVSLTLAQARRLALAAQGFSTAWSRARPRARVDIRHVRSVLDHVQLLQIDSVNVLCRAHYQPLFSRLGPYPMQQLDDAAYRRSELYEYWGHEASLLPIDTYPLLRHRMRSGRVWSHVARLAREHPDYIEKVERIVAERGPITAGEIDASVARGGWWEWSQAKLACEWLFGHGRVAVAGRQNFTRLYDIPERVIQRAVLDAPEPDVHDAQKLLLLRAARALGVATVADLADYFRLKPTTAGGLVEALVREGKLQPVRVEGWRADAFVLLDMVLPRRVDARALIGPFDPLVWFRPRAERLFGFRYRIEIYIPAAKRTYGYYVLPFVLGDRLVARVDLKANRQAGRLQVRAAWKEPSADPAATARELAQELELMASWLALGAVDVERGGDLADALRAAML